MQKPSPDAVACSDETPQRLLVVGPDQGQPLSGPTGQARIIARSSWSGGRVLIFDQVLVPGTLMGAHHHTEETQGAYVLSGEIGFWVDGDETIAGPGAYVVRPPGKAHASWNAGDADARMLEITTPAERYQEFILGFLRLRSSPESSTEALSAHAAAYGTHFHDEVTSELSKRLGFDGS